MGRVLLNSHYDQYKESEQFLTANGHVTYKPKFLKCIYVTLTITKLPTKSTNEGERFLNDRCKLISDNKCLPVVDSRWWLSRRAGTEECVLGHVIGLALLLSLVLEPESKLVSITKVKKPPNLWLKLQVDVYTLIYLHPEYENITFLAHVMNHTARYDILCKWQMRKCLT